MGEILVFVAAMVGCRGGGFFFFFFLFWWFGCGYGNGWLWLGWACGLVLVESSNLWGLWVAMVVIGLVVAGGSYWFAWFVGLFMVVLPSKKERERQGKREMEEKGKNKKK